MGSSKECGERERERNTHAHTHTHTDGQFLTNGVNTKKTKKGPEVVVGVLRLGGAEEEDTAGIDHGQLVQKLWVWCR